MDASLQVRALCGDDFMPKSEVGHWLLACRRTRALRSWITPGAYAWLVLTDQLKIQQRKLLAFRRAHTQSSTQRD